MTESHHHAKNQKWRLGTEKHARTDKTDQNGQPINQSTTDHSANLSLLYVTPVDCSIGQSFEW